MNELDILVQFEEDVIAGRINQTGNYTTREWSFLITELARDFDTWKEKSPAYCYTVKDEETSELKQECEIEWKTMDWIQNMVRDQNFADIPPPMQKEIMDRQVVSSLVFPFFNDPNTIGVTYYTGYESGLTIFNGSPID